MHALLSLHAVPSGAFELEQTPVAGLQVPAKVHGPLAVHVRGVPEQVPPVQTSFAVQALPSLQLVPLGAAEVEQAPVVGSQLPASWQDPLAVQTTVFPPTHVPPAQAYV